MSNVVVPLLVCFDSNGAQTQSDLPCNPDGTASACCSPGWQCVSNLYCRNTDNGNEVPGSCTNGAWGLEGTRVPVCPCPPRSRHGGPVTDYRDGTTTCGFDGFICGAYKEAQCDNSTGAVLPVIDYGSVKMNVIPHDLSVGWTTYYAGQTVSTAQSYSSTISTALATTSHTPTSPISASASPATSPSSATSSSADDASLSTSAKAGIGVGVGVGVPLIFAILLLAFCLRKRSRASRPPSVQGHMQQSAVDDGHTVSTSLTSPNMYKKPEASSMLFEASSQREVGELPGHEVERMEPDVERRGDC